jgi:acyl-CoA thioesterase
MSKLDKDTTVSGKRGEYRIHLVEDWQVWFPNGGYLAAIALRAVGRETALPLPASMTCQFLSVGTFDEARVSVVCVRNSSIAECFHVTISQGEKTLVTAQVWTCAEVPGLRHVDVKYPDAGQPQDTPSLDEIIPDWPPYPFLRNVEQRVLDFIPWHERAQPRPPRELQWVRFRPEGDFSDAFLNCSRYLILIDMVGWDAAKLPHPQEFGFIAPTLSLTADFHDSSTESWLLTEAWAPIATQGRVTATSRVWTGNGRVLASGSTTMICRKRPAYLPGPSHPTGTAATSG